MKKQTSLFYRVFVSSTTILFLISFTIIALIYLLFPAAYTETIIEQNAFYTNQLLEEARDVETVNEMHVLINAYEQLYGISTYIENEQKGTKLVSADFQMATIELVDWEKERDNLIEILTTTGSSRYIIDKNVINIDSEQFVLYTTTKLDNTQTIMKPFVQMSPFIAVICFIQALGVSYFVSRQILKPIKVLSKKATAITNLDFDNELSWNSNDEYGELSENLDEMQAKMKQVISHLEDDAYLRNQLALEEQKEKIAILSHELNTPLTVLKMQLELLINSEADENKLVYLNKNITKVDEITKLVDQILDYKCLDDVEIIEIGSFVRDLVETNYPRSDIELIIEDTREVEVSPMYLSRLLMNLINNAIKYNYQNQKIIIQINANSLKISNHHHPKFVLDKNQIFRPYVRGTNDKKIAGEGLGLYICKRICALNQFVIDVESTDQIFTAVVIFKISGNYLERLK
ncbi:HAMP domain-containing sensor histidine kinase [Mollicutes bacterium LVI A0039]|nr:HAMP domain-containing sensor histidine kinase [Mollicutes bacterium LVI A0039]